MISASHVVLYLPKASLSASMTSTYIRANSLAEISWPDSFFSLEPHELKDLIKNIRNAEKALGKIHYGLTEEEKKSRIFRRSLFVVKNIRKGEINGAQTAGMDRPLLNNGWVGDVGFRRRRVGVFQ